ncbi:MAG: class I SAM-dependent methyltransferase [Herpetosiphon sp.]
MTAQEVMDQQPSTMASLDQAKQEAFAGKVLGDCAGFQAVLMSALGDRLGLFKDLAANGPATSEDLAARAGMIERYAREWLGGMASAGYLAYDPGSRRFTLPPEHASLLAQEGGPMFLGGGFEQLISLVPQLDRIEQAFKQGGGVALTDYHDHFWLGTERMTAGWFDNLLIPVWLPAMPAVRAKLEQGAHVADVGCGHGRALITLAQAYPNAHYVGYDVHAPSIGTARARARAAGVDDRVRFEVLDVAHGLPERYDVITTFDVIHDQVDPRGILRVIHQALQKKGIYVCLEVNCSDKLEENLGPLGTIWHGMSIFFCLTTSLAQNGEGLGTLGLHEAKLRELCAAAGFSRVCHVPIDNLFSNLYEINV